MEICADGQTAAIQLLAIFQIFCKHTKNDTVTEHIHVDVKKIYYYNNVFVLHVLANLVVISERCFTSD